MGSCFSAIIKSQTALHYRKGRNDMSKSSSKVSSAIMPSTPQTSSDILQSPDLKSFCFSELKEATGYFSIDNELGKGAFGCVFKGWIDEHSLKAATPKTGMTVAAKMLYQTGCQTKQEWLAEIECLGQLCHPNLVKLIGFCLEDNHRLLIYEFMPNGNLANHLFGYGAHRKPLSWNLCMKAALDAAKGLAFLHDKGGVIYGDFKTSNILLDSKCNAKLCDFGLAKGGLTRGKSHAGFLGTAGYVAPEYINTGHITAKSNVYSFGVVLLEMVFGQQAISMCMENQFKEQEIVKWASKVGRSGLKIGELASQCISKEPECRPNMKDVVQVLEEVSELH